MQKHDPKPQKKVEFHRLLGFAAVRDELGENIDFQAEIIEAKLGAKVGVEAWVACEDIAVHRNGDNDA